MPVPGAVNVLTAVPVPNGFGFVSVVQVLSNTGEPDESLHILTSKLAVLLAASVSNLTFAEVSLYPVELLPVVNACAASLDP